MVAEIYDHHMPSPVPRMKDDLNCSVFSFLSYKSFNIIFSGLDHTYPEIFQNEDFFRKKKKDKQQTNKRALVAYSNSFRLPSRKRLNNVKRIHKCPYIGCALYDVWHKGIRLLSVHTKAINLCFQSSFSS